MARGPISISAFGNCRGSAECLNDLLKNALLKNAHNLDSSPGPSLRYPALTAHAPGAHSPPMEGIPTSPSNTRSSIYNPPPAFSMAEGSQM